MAAALGALRIRSAGPADADAVADVLLASRRAFLAGVPWAHADDDVRIWLRDHLVAAGKVQLAEIDARVVAMLAVSHADGVYWIEQLLVAPGHTRCGVGGRLLDAALVRCGRPVRLFTFAHNLGARRFYERHGFRAIRFGDGSGNEEGLPDGLYELAE